MASTETPVCQANTCGGEKSKRRNIRKRISSFFADLTSCFLPWKKTNKVGPEPLPSVSSTSVDFVAEQAVALALKKSLTCELDDTL